MGWSEAWVFQQYPYPHYIYVRETIGEQLLGIVGIILGLILLYFFYNHFVSKKDKLINIEDLYPLHPRLIFSRFKGRIIVCAICIPLLIFLTLSTNSIRSIIYGFFEMIIVYIMIQPFLSNPIMGFSPSPLKQKIALSVGIIIGLIFLFLFSFIFNGLNTNIFQ